MRAKTLLAAVLAASFMGKEKSDDQICRLQAQLIF